MFGDENMKVYMDNNATTSLAPAVLEEMLPYYKEVYGNPSSKFYDVGRKAESALFELRQRVADRKIFVQGSIDLIIETPDGEILLCDYKTDRISKEERADRGKLVANMKKRHSNQLEQYRYAVEQIFGKSPAKMFIYSTPLGEAIEIK